MCTIIHTQGCTESYDSQILFIFQTTHLMARFPVNYTHNVGKYVHMHAQPIYSVVVSTFHILSIYRNRSTTNDILGLHGLSRVTAATATHTPLSPPPRLGGTNGRKKRGDGTMQHAPSIANCWA